MSTYNLSKKNIDTFWLKKAPYQELCQEVCYIFLKRPFFFLNKTVSFQNLQ